VICRTPAPTTASFLAVLHGRANEPTTLDVTQTWVSAPPAAAAQALRWSSFDGLVRAAVKTALAYYSIGFQESSELLRDRMGAGFCVEITRQANEILRERKGEK
jgi:hypothetical protein